MVVMDVAGGFAEGISVEVLRFDAGDVASISRNVSSGLLGL